MRMKLKKIDELTIKKSQFNFLSTSCLKLNCVGVFLIWHRQFARSKNNLAGQLKKYDDSIEKNNKINRKNLSCLIFYLI